MKVEKKLSYSLTDLSAEEFFFLSEGLRALMTKKSDLGDHQTANAIERIRMDLSRVEKTRALVSTDL